MRRRTWVVLLTGLLLVGFSLWGLRIEDGMHTFDEMAGLIPFAAGLLGALLLLVALLLGVRDFFRRR